MPGDGLRNVSTWPLISEENEQAAEHHAAKIGQLNGKWSVLFRVQIAMVCFSLPFLITLEVWQTTSIHDLKVSQAEVRTRMDNLVTQADSKASDAMLKDQILQVVEQRYPPQWLRDEVSRLRDRLDKLEARD